MFEAMHPDQWTRQNHSTLFNYNEKSLLISNPMKEWLQTSLLAFDQKPLRTIAP